MDEHEFQRILNLFPVVRPRDYHAESEAQLMAQPAQNELHEWHDAWDGKDKEDTTFQDAFWGKLNMAAEKKVGAVEAERFCKAFQRIHKKLVHEALSLDAARSFLSSSKS